MMFRKILRISYKDHVTNEEIRTKIQQAIGPHENLLTMVKRRKLQWYGHVSPFIRSGENHLAKHGEKGKKTRQTEVEVGSIRDWTGLEFGRCQRAVKNRGKMEETGCEMICGAPTTFAVKG